MQDWAKRKIVVLSDRYNARSLPNEMKICGMRREISYAGKFLIKKWKDRSCLIRDAVFARKPFLRL